MPGYEYRDLHHTLIVTYPIGTAPRILDCPKCGAMMRLVIGAGVNVAPSALETKGRAARNQIEHEHQLRYDLDAYKRMRDRGIQPDQVQGSAAIENDVGDTFDVKYRDLYEHASKERIQEGVAAAQLHQMGVQ